MKAEFPFTIINLIAEATRSDGGWVALGESLDGRWMLIARQDQTVWIRELPPDLATARFLEWIGFDPGREGEFISSPVVHDPDRFQVPPPDVLRKVGFRMGDEGQN